MEHRHVPVYFHLLTFDQIELFRFVNQSSVKYPFQKPRFHIQRMFIKVLKYKLLAVAEQEFSSL